MTTATLPRPRITRLGPGSAGLSFRPKEFDAITDLDEILVAADGWENEFAE